MNAATVWQILFTAALSGFGYVMWRLGKAVVGVAQKIDLMADIVLGDPERDMPGVLKSQRATAAALAEVQGELRHNGGASVKDVTVRIERKLDSHLADAARQRLDYEDDKAELKKRMDGAANG